MSAGSIVNDNTDKNFEPRKGIRMQWFSNPHFNFIGNRKKAFVFSAILLVLTILSLLYHPYRQGMGPNLSIDFVGGTLMQVKFDEPIAEDRAQVQRVIADLGYGTPEVKRIGAVEDAEIQIVVKAREQTTEVSEQVREALGNAFPDNQFTVRRTELVGPKIGGELQQKAIWAILLSLVSIVIYIGLRFNLPFGIAAIVALFHDVLITIGVFSVLNVEISLPIIAALLTIVGYSLNDTIVVFDRIRENLSGSVSKTSFEDKVNTSINESLSRTVITSITTFVVVLTIYAFFFTTGDVLKYFSGALLAGVLVGTYSSIFIASPTLVLWNKKWPIKS